LVLSDASHGYDLMYASADVLRQRLRRDRSVWDVTVRSTPAVRGPETIFAASASKFGEAARQLRIGTPMC